MLYRELACHYTWWRGDPLPALEPLTGFRASPCADLALLARLHGMNEDEMAQRIADANHPYVAWLGDEPVAYGWAATVAFGVLDAGLHWELEPGERGLWDFATLPAWRGRGVYPRLLQAIFEQEADARSFWIGHLGENTASRRGICAAGFQMIGLTVVNAGGAWLEVPRGPEGRAYANPMAQGLPFVHAADEEILFHAADD